MSRSLHRAGFTLVELLVVVGIIALLIAILMPALSRSRRAANSLACQANLRSIGQALVMCAGDRKGFMPFGPLMYVSAGITPAGLNDTGRQRYTYYRDEADSNREVVMPMPAALAPYLGQKSLRSDSRANLEEDLAADGPVRKTFTCAEQGEAQRGRMTSNWTMPGPFVFSSYAINEGVFGDDGSNTSRRRGRLHRIPRPAENAMLCDALPRQEWGPDFFLVIASGGRNQSFATGVGSPTLLDYKRHRRWMNVLFADGRVAPVQMTPVELAKTGVTLGF